MGANPSINDLLSEGRVGDAVKVGASRLWNKVNGKGQRPTPSAPAAPKPPIATANATASEDAEMIQPSSSRVTPSPGMQVLKDLRMGRAEREAGKKAVGMAGGGRQSAYGPYGRKANVSPQQLLEAGLKPMGRMRRPPTHPVEPMVNAAVDYPARMEHLRKMAHQIYAHDAATDAVKTLHILEGAAARTGDAGLAEGARGIRENYGLGDLDARNPETHARIKSFILNKLAEPDPRVPSPASAARPYNPMYPDEALGADNEPLEPAAQPVAQPAAQPVAQTDPRQRHIDRLARLGYTPEEAQAVADTMFAGMSPAEIENKVLTMEGRPDSYYSKGGISGGGHASQHFFKGRNLDAPRHGRRRW